MADFKKLGCQLCPETDPCCLEAHHVKKKNWVVGSNLGHFSPRTFSKELEKCVCLCSNCHLKVHAGRAVLATT